MTDDQQILDAIRRLVRQLRLTDRAAQSEVGLSGAQLFVLAELGKTPELSINELAERTKTDQSSVSVVVARLVEAGLVARQRADDDGRRLALTLTRAGRQLLQRAPMTAQQRLIAAIEALPSVERKRFADTFRRLVDGIGGSDEEPAPMLTFDDERSPRKRRSKDE